MRKISINYPVDLEIVDEELTLEGSPSAVSSESGDYNLSLLREGSSFSELGDLLTFRPMNGLVSGNHRIQSSPSEFGAVPRNFSRPFKFTYSFKENPNPQGDFLGQSEKSVKDFLDFKISGGQGDESFRHRQCRLCSLNGRMILISQKIISQSNRPAQVVNISRWEENLNSFQLIHSFTDQPVDTGENASQIESGSPDFCVLDGKLYVAYRVSEDGLNFIIVNRNLDEDLLTWETVSKEEIKDCIPGRLDDFRLRIATNGIALMVCFFAVAKRYSPVDPTQRVRDLRDFRTYVSMDRGKSFLSKFDTYKNIQHSSAGFSVGEGAGDVFNYFIPYFTYSEFANQSIFNDFNVNFDLYFDENMGSFVILKPGDGPNSVDKDGIPNSAYLMGIKTNSADHLEWEPCLRQPLNWRITGAASYDTGVFLTSDPYNETFHNPNPDSFCYIVKDVCIVAGETINDLILSVEETNGGAYQTKGVVATEFTFVDSSLIRSGHYEEIYAYGGKYHERYGFCCDLINIEIGGVASLGYKNNISPTWSAPMACRWKNQLVASAFVTRPGISGYHFLSIMGPISNLGETHGYQMAYTPYLGSLVDIGGYATISGGGASYSFTSDNLNKITVSDSLSFANISIDNSFDSSFSTGNYTPFYRVGEDPVRNFKAKLRFKLEGFTTLDSAAGMTLISFFLRPKGLREVGSTVCQITLKRSGGVFHLFILDASGLSAPITSMPLVSDKWYDLLVVNDYDGPLTVKGNISLFAKESNSLEWAFLYDKEITTSTGSKADSNFISLGSRGTVTTTGGSIYFKDFHFSTYGTGYRTLYGASKRDHGPRREPFLNLDYSLGNEHHVASPVKVFSRDIELLDGSQFRLEGGKVETSVRAFSYEPSITRNSSVNVINGLADSVYDFTRRYDSTQGCNLIFKNKDREDVDILSLVNLNGIKSFTLRAGSYNETTGEWLPFEEQYYILPYMELSVGAVDSYTILLSEGTFESSQLVGYSLFVVDTASSVYEKHMIIIENFDSFIKVDEDLSLYNLTGKELRLVKNSMSFAIPDSIGQQSYEYFQISFDSPAMASLRSIGEVILGRWIDLSSYHLEMEDSLGSNSDTQEGEHGLMYTSRVDKGNTFTSGSMSFTHLSEANGEYRKVLDLFSSIYKRQRAFPFVEFHTDGQSTNYGVISSGLVSEPVEFAQNLQVEMIFQNWRARSNDTFKEPRYAFDLVASNSEPGQGESVIFSPYPVNYSGTGFTYKWDFADGSIVANTEASVSHSFANLGEYLVTCTLLKDGEPVAFRQRFISVNRLGINSYVTAADQISIDTFNLYIEGRDVNSIKVLDSFTQVALMLFSGPNVIFNTATSVTLSGGVAQFSITTTSPDESILLLVDSFGRTMQIPLQINVTT